MDFIILTQIKKASGVESEIVGKIAIPRKIMQTSIIMETTDLLPPEGFYEADKINYDSPTSTIVFTEPIGNISSVSVAENIEKIRSLTIT